MLYYRHITPAAVRRIEAAGCDPFDVNTLISRHRNRVEGLPLRRDAIRQAQRDMRVQPDIKSIAVTVMNADDSLELIRVGPRGGVKRIARLYDRKGHPV